MPAPTSTQTPTTVVASPSRTGVPSSPAAPATDTAPPASLEAGLCSGDGFSVAYPDGWYVHPADPTAGAADCSLFAAEPLNGSRESDWGWTGAQIVLRLAEGCQGSFEAVLSEQEIKIEGFPAWVRTKGVGAGPNSGELSAYEYTVNLAPTNPCETGRWFFGRTDVEAPGDFEVNQHILDEMMDSVRFTQ